MKEYIVLAVNEMSVKQFDELGAPELVRCKDCKHYENCEVNDLLLNHEDGYCSDGEKTN